MKLANIVLSISALATAQDAPAIRELGHKRANNNYAPAKVAGVQIANIPTKKGHMYPPVEIDIPLVKGTTRLVPPVQKKGYVPAPAPIVTAHSKKAAPITHTKGKGAFRALRKKAWGGKRNGKKNFAPTKAIPVIPTKQYIQAQPAVTKQQVLVSKPVVTMQTRVIQEPVVSKQTHVQNVVVQAPAKQPTYAVHSVGKGF